MEQFQKIGEVLGSIRALMVFHNNIQVNQRQCCLLFDMLTSAFDTIAEEMRQSLKFEEKNTKWKALEQPLKELYKVFREGEIYLRQCFEGKNWWGKTITLCHNTDCIEFHLHNLLSCLPTVIEAIEIAGQDAGSSKDEVQKKKLLYIDKYKKDWQDPKLFQWKFGTQYLVTEDFCQRFENVCKEDQWILMNNIQAKKNLGSKYYQKFADHLLVKLSGSESPDEKLLPCSILIGAKDYHVRKRLGSGSQYKEITWLGENFALWHFFEEVETLIPEISLLSSLSHPNIRQFLCGFTDNEKKECFFVMELMSRDLSTYIKEACGPRKRIPFALPVSVDIMLQIARGMEYLHSKMIFHGELNPFNILVKGREGSKEGYLHVKVSGFGLSSVNRTTKKNFINQNEMLSFIWHAPEVLEEQEQMENTRDLKLKPTEKADVYSFGMICFELLTGKVPFEDSHMQGDKMSRNIRAGERPLFSFHPPRYITHLTKKCWHADPNQRPNFSSICRILRRIKHFLLMNPDHSSLVEPPLPLVDYSDIEAGLLRKFPSWGRSDPIPVSQIPFQMFAYTVTERERTSASDKDYSESGSDKGSICGDENTNPSDESTTFSNEMKHSTSVDYPKSRLQKNAPDAKVNKPGTPRGRCRPPKLAPSGRHKRMNSESKLLEKSPRSPRLRRSSSGHILDRHVVTNPRSPRWQRSSSGHISDSQVIAKSPRSQRSRPGHISDSEVATTYG